jgi:hypothetical protein
MNDTLKSLAETLLKAGLPSLAGALGGPVGAGAASVIIGALADALGVPATPEAVAAKVDADPQAAAVKLKTLEVLQTQATMQREIAVAEMARDSWFSWAWRPAMSWLIIVLWAYALLILPLVNFAIMAAFKLPEWPIHPIPMENLTAFTGIWIAAYSGGNTLIRVMGKKD